MSPSFYQSRWYGIQPYIFLAGAGRRGNNTSEASNSQKNSRTRAIEITSRIGTLSITIERKKYSRRTIFEGLEGLNLATYRRAWQEQPASKYQQPWNPNYSRAYVELYTQYRNTADEGEILRKQLSPNAGSKLHIKATLKTLFFQSEKEDIGSGNKNKKIL